MKFLLSTLFMIAFVSCSNKNSDFLEIYYLDEGLLFSSSIECNMIQSKWYEERRHYIKIEDEEFVDKFKLLFNKLEEPNEVYGLNTRIQILYHHENKIDTICLGEHFSTSVNGIRKKDSPELLKLIKDRIYK